MRDLFEHLIQEFQLPLINPVLIFSLILIIILLSPLLLKKVNIPGIIGLIISGMIIGPHGLNILEKNSAVDLFSTIGLLYIMFIAGLELDLNEFISNRHKSILFGFFTFIIPIGIGYPVCRYIFNYDINASLLTSGMFATHTLVTYPIVSKFGLSKNQAVAVTVGGTILADTAVLILLAIITGSDQGGLNQEFWIKLGISLALFSALVFLVIPPLTKWFFRELESEKHSHYIFVLSMVFFSAFFAEAAGVEPIIGAFFAGLALNRLIPNSSALMNRIEFIGNALFIPFFLISVGMLIKINVIFTGIYSSMIAGVLFLVAVTSKWIAAWLTQVLFKYSRVQRQLIFGLSISRVAATLAVILVGYNEHIIDETIFNSTILLILLTCVVSSFVTEKAAKQMVLTLEDDNSSDTLKMNNEHLLLAIANISNIEKLFEFSMLIKDKKSINPISILTVVPNNREAEANILKSKTKLEEYVKQASAHEIKVNIIATIDHNAVSGITRTAREIMAQIIVIGWTQQTGIFAKFFGHKVDSILSNSDKSIFVCNIHKAFITNTRVVIISPPLSEHENGFGLWLNKVGKISKELNIPLLFCCNERTKEALVKENKQGALKLNYDFKLFENWDDFLILSRYIQETDLLILVSARKGSVSYISILDQLPIKIEKYFSRNNKIIIYPNQYEQNFQSTDYEDFTFRTGNKKSVYRK